MHTNFDPSHLDWPPPFFNPIGKQVDFPESISSRRLKKGLLKDPTARISAFAILLNSTALIASEVHAKNCFGSKTSLLTRACLSSSMLGLTCGSLIFAKNTKI